MPYTTAMNAFQTLPVATLSGTKNPPVTNHAPVVNQLWKKNATIARTG